MINTNNDGEVFSQVEVERRAKCEELAGDIINAYKTADWETVRRMFWRQIAMIRITVVMGLLFTLVLCAIYYLSHTGDSVVIGELARNVVLVWMMSAGITGIFAFTAWMKIVSDNSWHMAKGGDVIDGVVVDILTITFIHDYMKRTKKLFKTYFLLSNITCCVLIQVLGFTYKIHGVKGFSVEGRFYTLSYFMRLWLCLLL